MSEERETAAQTISHAGGVGVVALLGTLDTKGAEVDFLRTTLDGLGVASLIVDIGIRGEPRIGAAITRDDVAAAAGTTISVLVAGDDRGKAVEVMMDGATQLVAELFEDGRIAGVLALGGSAGTTIATAAMRALPVGVPKVMVSTMASGNIEPYVGTKDICMLYSVVDFTGLNRISRRILSNAAGAMAGMLSASRIPVAANACERPLVGATMFGVTTPCVEQVRVLLEAAGYELLVFHATGTGGRAMEDLVRDGLLDGVLDITTTELADELVGGVLSAGPDRLEIAGRMGVPQVISLGALDMVNFGAPDTIPASFQGRLFYEHNQTVTLMRTTPWECTRLGELIAQKANGALGPVVLVMPLRGVSAIDKEGQVFHDVEADQALFNAIRDTLADQVRLVEVDAHINDAAFAQVLVEQFLEKMAHRCC